MIRLFDGSLGCTQIAASSASVYGQGDAFPTAEDHHPYNNRTWYGATKILLEGLLRSFNDMYGLPYIALRYFNVYGPRMDMHGKYTEVLIRWMERLAKGEKGAALKAAVAAAADAKDRFIRSNLRHVVSIARRYPLPQGMDVEELEP